MCVHMGAASDKMEVVNAVVNAGVPVQQLLLTHMERPRSTPEGTCWGRDAVQWLTRGGHCDFTAGDDVCAGWGEDLLCEGCVEVNRRNAYVP